METGGTLSKPSGGHVGTVAEWTKGAFGALARRVSWRFRRGPAKRRQTEKTGLGERDRCALRERITERIPAVTYVLEVGEPSDTVYCSPQVEAMLGYPPEVFEKDRTHWIKVLHPDDRERILAEDARAGSTGEPFDAEYRCVARDGRTVWVHDKAVVTRDQEGLARFREGIMVDVTRRKVFEKQLEHLAFHDPLTDLPNRTLFMDRLRHALTRTDRRGKAVAVLFVDLDGFKRVNDSLGHYAGDRLLIAIANKLRACVRPEDTVARLSGDEFAMLLEDVTGAKDATLVAERLVDQLRTPFALEGREVYAGASVGISLGTSAEDRPGDLLRNADLALYEAKRRGKGRYEMFDGAARDRQAPEEDLRQALERGEFTVHYQPKITLETGVVAGAEALVRWRHPERGLLAAGSFMTLAERSGLIVPIGLWVLGEACKQAAAWQGLYPRSLLTVSVNLSAPQLRQPGFVAEVAKILGETGLDPARLVLEITERVAMDGEEFATLSELKGLGLRLEVEEFGTGYFSLTYLERLPVDSLKVDCSTTWGLGQVGKGEIIASATASLAHTLGWEAVAERVETGEQLARLRELGFDRAQGLYLAGSLPSEEVSALLAAGAPA